MSISAISTNGDATAITGVVAPPDGQLAAGHGGENSRRKPLLSIRSNSTLSALSFKEVWQFRDLLFGLAGRDVKLRYRQTALGVIWVLFQPLLGAGVFSIVFGAIAGLKSPSEKVPLFVSIYAAMLAWNAFSSTLGKAAGCLVGNANLVSKVYFPRMVLPLSTVFSTLIDFAVASVLMVVLLFAFKINPGFPVLLMPVWVAVVMLMAVGAGLFASAAMVTYRDVQHVLPVLIQMLLYASPIFWTLKDVQEKPPWLQWFAYANPLTGVLEAFRWSLLGFPMLQWWSVLYSVAFTAAAFVLGSVYFLTVERRFADVI